MKKIVSERQHCPKSNLACPLGCEDYCKVAAKAPQGTKDIPKGCTLIEDRDVYDGWCAYYNPATDEFIFRDAWFTNKLTQTTKDAIEFGYRKAIGQTMPVTPSTTQQ